MSNGSRDLQRKMRRTLQLTIQGEVGLIEGEAWWLDGTEVTFWCPEELAHGHLHAIRVDMLQQGGTIDVKARISEVYSRKDARIQHGCLLVASYETIRSQDRKSLDELISRLNPDAADGPQVSSSVASHGSATASPASKAKKRIAENRARRRRAASHMPETGDRLGVERGAELSVPSAPARAGATVPPAVPPAVPATEPAEERTPSASSTASSVSSRSPSQSRSRSESRARAAPEPEPVPAPPARPAPAEPPPVLREPVVESPSTAEPRKRKRPRRERVNRDERDARHRARMAALGSSGPASRSKSRRDDQSVSDRRPGEPRRAEPESVAPPSSAAGRRAPPREEGSQMPRSTSESIRAKRRQSDGVSDISERPIDRSRGRTAPDRMPASQPAPTGAAMKPVSAMLSPGDPPTVFVQFGTESQVRDAVHGDAPRPHCLIAGVSGLSTGDQVKATFQLPSRVFIQIAGRVLAIDGDRATLELSAMNPEDIANLLAARH